SLPRRLFKRELLQDITTLQLARLDVADKNNRLHPQDISVGAESILKACLDPSVTHRDPDRCKRRITCLVQRFLQDKQLCQAFPSLESRSEEFLSVQPMQKRLDIFLRDFLGKTYPELW
ncbi:hypothetical protein KUCAC02_037952, partial [Chaenocephalus aceratus]